MMLSSRVINTVKRINKKKIISLVCIFLLFGCLLLTSGYSATDFYFSNKISGIIHLLLFVSSFLFFVASVKPKSLIGLLKSKGVLKRLLNIKALSFSITFLLLFISIAINSFRMNNANGVLRLILISSSAFFIVSSISFKTFAKYFCYFLFAICTISLVIYPLALISSTSSSTVLFNTGTGNVVVSYGFLNFFLRYWHWSSMQDLINRMCGPFWEPSIFAAIISLGFLFLVQIRPRYWRIMLVAYIPCMILTFSTGGYFVSVLCLLYALSFKFKTTQSRTLFIIISLGVIALLLILFLGPLLPIMANLLPSIFDKFVYSGYSSSSFDIRANSFSIFMRVFSKSPLIGFGPNGAIKQYELLLLDSSDRAATSTIGFWMACFGIPGIFLITLLFIFPFFFNSNYKKPEMYFLGIIVLLLLNLENFYFVSTMIVFVFYFCKESIFGKTTISNYFANDDMTVKNLLLSPSSSESNTLFKNLNGSLIIKGLSMLVGLLTVPVYNSFFGTDELYGIWSVMISILSWSLLLDFGFGSGLRARLADALEKKETSKQKEIISSTYVGSSLASLLLFSISLVLILSIDLNSLLNIDTSVLSSLETKVSMIILSFGMCLEFTLKNVCYVLYAAKRSALGSFLTFASHFGILLFFIIFESVFSGHLFIYAAILYAIAVNLPLLIATIVVFNFGGFKGLAPSIKFFSIKTCKLVMSFGIVFFIIQVCFILVAETNSFSISLIYGPTYVSDYTKHLKFFSAIIGLMGAVVQQPIWSAIASSRVNKKFDDINKYKKLSIIIALSLFGLCVIIALLLQFVLDIWLGSNTISVNYIFVISIIIYAFSFLLSDAYIIVANSLKILKPQAIMTAIAAAIKIAFVFIINFSELKATIFSWSILLIIDGCCYAPFFIVLPILIKRKINRIKVEGCVDETE